MSLEDANSYITATKLNYKNDLNNFIKKSNERDI